MRARSQRLWDSMKPSIYGKERHMLTFEMAITYRLLLLRMKLRWAWLACDQLTLARLGGLASRKLCRSGWSP